MPNRSLLRDQNSGAEPIECVITTGGMCLNDEGQGQIGGANVVWDDGNSGNTAQSASGLRRTPAACYVCTVPEFI